MTTLNIFIVGGIILLIFLAGVGFTLFEFEDIESGETDRRKHIEEDVKVDDS